jgi:succinyl-CoA synthetase beta subunit
MKSKLNSWLDALDIENLPDEHETKQLLELFDIGTPRGVRLQPKDEIVVPLSEPWVVKVCNPKILHKTDVSGVITNVDTTSIEETVTVLRKRFPKSAVLVEEQIEFGGPEFIVGALVDPNLGPAVMVGAGGILAELYKDVAFRLIPCPPDETRRMIEELIIAPVFNGFRGMDMNITGLAEVINSVGKLVIALKESFNQLDINPLVYSNGHWKALDGRLILK